MDVDARVWNPDGYFEYPNGTPAEPGYTPAEPVQNAGAMILNLLRQGSSSTNQSQPNSTNKSQKKNHPKPLSIENAKKNKPRSNTGTPKNSNTRTSSRGKQRPKQNSSTKGSRKKPNDSDPKWAWSEFQSSPDPKSLPMPKMIQLSGRQHSLDEDPQGTAFLLSPATASNVLMMTPTKTSAAPPPPPNTPADTDSVQDMTKNLRNLLNLGDQK